MKTYVPIFIFLFCLYFFLACQRNVERDIVSASDTLLMTKQNEYNQLESLMIDSIKEGDTLSIIGVDFQIGFPLPQRRIRVWKEQEKYFVNLLKIYKDSSDNGENFTKELGSQFSEIRKLEIALRRMKNYSTHCDHPNSYYFILHRDTLEISDTACGSWNILSDLYYRLNDF